MTTQQASGMTLELDLIDHTALQPQDLVHLPSQLPCGICGIPQGRHDRTGCCGHPFERPRLPAGHRYADELSAGDRFSSLTRFSSATRPDRHPAELLEIRELRLAGRRSVQLQAAEHDGQRRTSLLDPSAIVCVES